jgi:ATP-dependent RNA helicase RhlE
LAFSALALHPALLRGVADLGFADPTPIQSHAIPPALQGRDLLACAATGSGKTAAFLLPILHHLVDRPRGTTRALVLAPTRELALQIVSDLEDLARHTGVRAAAVHGGVASGPQETAFRRGADVIVATPGRLLDHFQNAYAALAGLEYLVLDEADRMLDMGFLPDIRRILRHVPTPRQTLFFSATMPPPIETLTREILRSPARIALQRRPAPATGVRQSVYPVPSTLKGQLLVELLGGGHVQDALVFTRTRHRADRVTRLLNRNGITAERIHGNRSQAQRTRALAGFKAGQFQVLVATDIAARGIDVELLGHVVNFDVPSVPEDYIHRVGRTARAGATGEAITLMAPEEEADLGRIQRVVESKIPRKHLEGFAYDAAPQVGQGPTLTRQPWRARSPVARAMTKDASATQRTGVGCSSSRI